MYGSGGHVVVATGTVTSQGYGVKAYTENGAAASVTVNGDVSSSETGVYARAQSGASANVTIKGNVSVTTGSAQRAGISIMGTGATVEVYGDVSVSSSSAQGSSVLFWGSKDAQDVDVLVNGTVGSETQSFGVLTDAYGNPANGTYGLTVWKVAASEGCLFMKRVAYAEFEADEELPKTVNYIIRSADNVRLLAADGSALAMSHGYPVAKEGERVYVTAANGNKVEKMYNNEVEVTTKDENGNFYVTVPRGGGVSLTAVIGSVPAHDPVQVPSGKTLTYNGKSHTGVAAGEGYGLSGTASATKAGSYTATATLKADKNLSYTWSDGTTKPKTVAWKIKQASNKVRVANSSVNKTYKAKNLKKKAQTFALPKATANFGAVKWKVSMKDKQKVLSLDAKTGKIKVKKGAKVNKKGYVIKLKASVAGTANYAGATSQVVTVKAIVK